MTLSGTSEIVRSTAPEPGSFRDRPFAEAASQRRRCSSNAGVGCAPRPLGRSKVVILGEPELGEGESKGIAAELFDANARFSPSNPSTRRCPPRSGLRSRAGGKVCHPDPSTRPLRQAQEPAQDCARAQAVRCVILSLSKDYEAWTQAWE